MLFSLWRRLWSWSPGLSRGRRRVSYRPQLDPLEDRLLPALGAGGVLGLAAGGLTPGFPVRLQEMLPAPDAVRGLQQTRGKPPAAAAQMRMTVVENSPESVIELGSVFAAMSALHPKDGLQLSILGNTNSGLVATDLSGADLTLTYARGKCGTATITVGATDADGVSVRQTILVTVRPQQPAPTVAAETVPAPPQAR